jgi:hypothetical protein
MWELVQNLSYSLGRPQVKRSGKEGMRGGSIAVGRKQLRFGMPEFISGTQRQSTPTQLTNPDCLSKIERTDKH